MPLFLGINGAQGTGKSTLADFLDMACQALFDWRSAVLSIDDFYLTRAERGALAEAVHPLFATRGVPGTHDVAMLRETLDRLLALGDGQTFALPTFDKASDDRAGLTTWRSVEGPLDLIILEGWCVGSTAQTPEALEKPINDLERVHDAEATWRTAANTALSRDYEPLFDQLDALVFLAAPSFDAIYRWRLEQERKLAGRTGGPAIMDEAAIAEFISHYERITRHNLGTLPARADVIISLDEGHAVIASKGRILPVGPNS